MKSTNKDSNAREKKTILKQPLEMSLCVLLIAIVGVTFIQVLFRYIFHLSLAWSEELARFFFLWLAALASAYGFKTKSHFALSFLVNKFGKRIQRLIGSIVSFVVFIFLLLFSWKAFEYTLSVKSQIAAGTRLSMSVPYSAAFVGSVLMLYYVIRNWWTDFRRPAEAEKDLQ